VYGEEGQAAVEEGINERQDHGGAVAATLGEDTPGSPVGNVTFGVFSDDDDDYKEHRKSEAISTDAGADADVGAGAGYTATDQDATTATFAVANDSLVPVLLKRALCLPRVPNHSDNSAFGENSEAAADQSLFQTRLPAGGLVVVPGQEVQLTVFCAAPRFGGTPFAGVRARANAKSGVYVCIRVRVRARVCACACA